MDSEMKIRFKKPRLPARRGSPGALPKPKKDSVIETAPRYIVRPVHGFLMALGHEHHHYFYAYRKEEYASKECSACREGRCVKRVNSTAIQLLDIDHDVAKELN